MSKTPRTDELRAFIKWSWDNGGFQGYSEDEWLDHYQELETQLTAAKEKIAEQEATIKALREDAERLNWIEKNIFGHHWSGIIGDTWTWMVEGPYRHAVQKMRGNSFRDAIDAARKK